MLDTAVLIAGFVALLVVMLVIYFVYTKMTCTTCPTGWRADPVNPYRCTAPAGYQGSCDRVSVFNGYSKKQATKWATGCQAPWPNP